MYGQDEDGGGNVRGKYGDAAIEPVTTPDAGSDGEAQCTPDEKACDGQVAQTCDSTGTWQIIASCPFVCAAGDCTGVCSPRAMACAGISPQTCDGRGVWQVGAPCPFACNRGACVGRCTPGAHQCIGDVRQICDGAGQWQDEVTCPFACMGSECTGACVPGRTQCLSGEQQTCSAEGTWQTTRTATRELLVNPGFDRGEDGWTNPGIQIVYPADGMGGDGDAELAAQSAPDLAWLGGLNRQEDFISQVVTVPAGAASVTFSFSYAIYTAETTAAAPDVMDVQFVAGGVTTTVLHLTDNDAVATWTRFSAALPSSLSGQTVTIQFHAVTNANRITSFYVDTVSLLAAVCP